MSGHRMLAPDTRFGGPTEHRPRRRTLIAAASALSLMAFGAVAQAADDGGRDHDARRVAAVATSEPHPDDSSDDDSVTTEPTDDFATTEPTTDDTITDDSLPDESTPLGSPEPPDGLGSDAELNALAQQCFDGDLLACDHLFLDSPVDSDYEEYGDTCAGRQEAGTENYCELGLDDGPLEPTPPGDLGDDLVLDALANDCYAGNMDACDQLYDEAEADSDYQIYGDTCAGRQPEGTGQYCIALTDPVPGTGPITTTPDAPTTTSTATSTTGVVPTVTTPGTTPVTQPGQIPPATQEPTGLGADPALDALARRCYDGDMAACDELYNSSDADSDYRRYGDTCAGRQPEGTNIWCRTAFGDGTQTTNVTVTLPPDTVTVPVPPLTLPPTVPPFTVPGTAPLPTVPQLTLPPTIPVVTLPATIPGTPPSGPTLPPTSAAPGVIPPPTLQPTGLGTNPAFDALALACFNGDMKSCDDLYREASVDTDPGYSQFADTCAGRQPVGTGRWCEASFPATGVTTVPGATVPGATMPGTVAPQATVVNAGIPAATQQPTGLGNDPQLNTLAQNCFNGDMQACDDLFLQSELGSSYHEYGDTCAGRQRPGTYTYCTVAFPAVLP